jgi:hypothetical protein
VLTPILPKDALISHQSPAFDRDVCGTREHASRQRRRRIRLKLREHFDCDCSGFVSFILKRAAPDHTH